jgi:hypothetical protein
MKANLLIAVSFLCVATIIHAQSPIAVQSNGTTSLHVTMANALASVQSGDTIYIPGGGYNIGNMDINKKLILIGAGHDASHSTNGRSTSLNGTIRLLQGADGTELHGLYVSGDVQWGTNASNQVVNNVVVSRCNVSSIVMRTSNPTTSKNITISESIIRGYIYGGGATFVNIEKNIIDIQIFEFQNGHVSFTNNVFNYDYWHSSYYIFHAVTGCKIENNVIMKPTYPLNVDCSSNELNNNLLVPDLTILQSDLNSWQGNKFDQLAGSIFVNRTAAAFSYEFDYNLKESSPGKGAGTDEFDIGIYGSEIPYKLGSVPFNPQVTSADISTRPDENGMIEVKITVEAQER